MNPQPSEHAVTFRAAELYLQEKLRIAMIAEVLNREFPTLSVKLTRETVYPLLQRARELGFLRLVAPLEEKLAREIESKFSCPKGSVRVVDCPSPGSNEKVSAAAADWAVDLVKDLHQAVGGTVGLGLGPGRATLDFTRAFSNHLRNDPSLPKLNLVAISSASPARCPEYSSISFFNLFPPTSIDQQIGLFAETLVRSRSIQEIRTRPGCREAFEAAKDIHLVVTSMGDMEDEHALLRIWYNECQNEPKPSWWGEAVGDIQYRPYGQDRFIKDKPTDLRAVTLFELEDMVTLAQKRDRHVILIARQCGVCEPRRTKAKAVRPILKHPEMRIFSRLVVDSPTAYELLQGE
jgi:DNA-binding transcriptional regulator LsrR (DeoR family)